MIGLLVVFGGAVVVIFGVIPLRHWFDARQAARRAPAGLGPPAPAGGVASRRQAVWGTGVLSVAVLTVVGAVVAATLTGPSAGRHQARGASQSRRASPSHVSPSAGARASGVARNQPSVGPAGPPSAPGGTGATAPAGGPQMVAAEGPADAGSPVLADISPASGWPGQSVAISGTGLFSRNGVITLRFGSYQAPVSCFSQTACQAMVPGSMSAPDTGAVAVTLTTEAGTSNPVSFRYR